MDRNGSFQVVRRLAQDLPAWWAQAGAARRQLDKEGFELPPGTGTEWLAARVVGRWRSGVSVAHNPNAEPPTKPGAPDDNLIGYIEDEHGHTTPHFAHIRKPIRGTGSAATSTTPKTGAGDDPIIGKDSDITLKLDTKPNGKKLHFTQFVRTEGMVYAFALSLSTLRDLAG